MQSLLIFLTDVVRRGCDNELERFSRDRFQEVEAVARIDYNMFRKGEFV